MRYQGNLFEYCFKLMVFDHYIDDAEFPRYTSIRRITV